jgi:hypothetical protein
MKKILLSLAIFCNLLFGDLNLLGNIYFGINGAVGAKGIETFGSASNSPSDLNYDVDRAISYIVGFEINNLIKAEFAHEKYYSDEHYDLNINTLEFILTPKNSLSSKNLFHSDYLIYPTVGAGVTYDTLAFSGGLNYEYSDSLQFYLKGKFTRKGLGIGGGGNNLTGVYFGFSYFPFFED